jgi:hypothetical protein
MFGTSQNLLRSVLQRLVNQELNASGRASTCREISLQKEILACARKRARKSNLPGNGKEI